MVTIKSKADLWLLRWLTVSASLCCVMAFICLVRIQPWMMDYEAKVIFGCLSFALGAGVVIFLAVWLSGENDWRRHAAVKFVPVRQEPSPVNRPHAGHDNEVRQQLGKLGAHIDQKV